MWIELFVAKFFRQYNFEYFDTKAIFVYSEDLIMYIIYKTEKELET